MDISDEHVCHMMSMMSVTDRYQSIWIDTESFTMTDMDRYSMDMVVSITVTDGYGAL